jgi:predicted dehydrogenase
MASQKDSLRWGFMGTGRIAYIVARDFGIAELKIQAVGSRNLDTANEFADEFGIDDIHGSYEALVANPNVDIVYISTLNHVHAANALLAINAGKHVLLEKPFTMDVKEAKELQKAAKEKGVFLMEAMWTRFLPSMDAVMKAIEDGLIGKPNHVIADHSQYLPVDVSERLWKLEHGGGALLDLGIYPISFAARVLGIPDEVIATGRIAFEGVDEAVSIILNYDNGAQAALTTSMTVAGPVTAVVMGEKGSIEIDRTFYAQTTFTVYDNQRNVLLRYDKEPAEGTGRQFQAMEAERCVKAGLIESPIMSVSESVEIMQILDDVRDEIGVEWV